MNRGQRDELLDLVDQEGNIIGTETRQEVYKRKNPYFRLVEVVLKNMHGEVLVLTRSRENAMMPGLLETLGGHCRSGESDKEAARREIKEEVGIDIPPLQLQFLGYTTPTDGAVGYCSVFLAVTDENVKLNEEHSCSQWVSPHELSGLLRENVKQFRSNIPIILSQYAREIFSK